LAGVRAGRGAVVVAGALAWAVVLVCPGRLPAEPPGALDLGRTLLAKDTLQRDPVLAPLDLGVTVRKGVATLYGPVPSRELGERAVALLRRLPELSGVRNQLFVEASADPQPQKEVAARPRPPHWTASRPEGNRRPPPPAPVERIPAPAPPPQPSPAPAWRPVPAPAGAPPDAAPKRPEAPAVVPALRVPTPATPPPILAAAEKLRSGQERFRRVRVEVQGDRVLLSGSVARLQDVYDLSQAISELAGVAGVTVRAVRVDPPSR
jgi:hypothetical protein